MVLSKLRSFFKDIFSIKRLSLIGAIIISSKLVLILIAYFFDETEYNTYIHLISVNLTYIFSLLFTKADVIIQASRVEDSSFSDKHDHLC